MHIKKHPSKVRRLVLPLMALFGIDRRNKMLVNRPDIYYKHVYFTKRLYDGIELVAKIENVNGKKAAELLMKAGLSSYMGAKLTDYIKNDRAARELNQKMKMTRFVMILRRHAREHGMDISRII
jgi:hypothetical protein